MECNKYNADWGTLDFWETEIPRSWDNFLSSENDKFSMLDITAKGTISDHGVEQSWIT